jgi:hypothetical protein
MSKGRNYGNPHCVLEGIMKWLEQEKVIERKVEEAVVRALAMTDRRIEPPSGYNPVQVIMGVMFEWLLVPWCGQKILVQVRYPNSIDKTGEDTQVFLNHKDTELSREDMLRTMNTQEEIAKQVLNIPTYAELEKEIWGKDRRLAEMRDELKSIEEKITQVNNAAAAELRKRAAMLDIQCGYALPPDTMAALSRIGLATDITDIRKITLDMFLEAYQKSKLYGRPPSEFIPTGVYTTEQKRDIDNAALAAGADWEKSKKLVKKGRR